MRFRQNLISLDPPQVHQQHHPAPVQRQGPPLLPVRQG
nr:MAG TPA: hypothetical protein [Caudoviricetes sp.]